MALERAGADWLAVGEHGRYRAPIVVNAAGAWAGDVAAMVGDAVDLRVRASMMMVTERMPRFLDPVIASVGRKLSFKQSDAGTVVIGGGQQGRPTAIPRRPGSTSPTWPVAPGRRSRYFR